MLITKLPEGAGLTEVPACVASAVLGVKQAGETADGSDMVNSWTVTFLIENEATGSVILGSGVPCSLTVGFGFPCVLGTSTDLPEVISFPSGLEPTTIKVGFSSDCDRS